MVEFILTAAGYVVGLPLELLVIAALLHGGYRQFPLVFAYIIAEFLTTVIEMPLALAYYHTRDPHIAVAYVQWYWRDEVILQFLVFVVVISLIWQATSAARSRRPLRAALILGVILLAGISFLVHFNPKVPTGVWMTPWKRDLNFGSAILDMALWAMLIAKRQKDSRILMLSGGLGIMFAGQAIGESLRTGHLSRAVVLPGSVLVMIINLLFYYIWWQTFRAPRTVLSAP
ncbi:MAG: hypothetical protein ACLQU1_01050 [Bryobacteraceae bacterium]